VIQGGGEGGARGPGPAVVASASPLWCLPFTRYYFTSKRLCGSPSSLHPPLHLHCPHTIAILLRDYCAIYDLSPAPLLGAIHHTILAMAISCKGQCDTARVGWQPSRTAGRIGLYKIFLKKIVYARIQHPFITPAHLHHPHYCNTIARLLRPSDPPFICHTPYNTGNDNIV